MSEIYGYRGWEFEFGTRVIDANNNPRNHEGARIISRLWKPLKTPDGVLGGLGAFRENGSRLYLDCGSHVEMATAEVNEGADVVGAVAYAALTNMSLLHGSEVGRYESDPLTLELNARVHGFRDIKDARRAVDDAVSWGVHLNHQVSSTFDPNDMRTAELLASMRAPMHVIGAGLAERDGSLVRSQRTRFIEDTRLKGDNTTDAFRPYINTRDEPLGRLDRPRLHGVHYEYSLNPWGLTAVPALVSAALAIMQSRTDASGFLLNDPIAQAKKVGGGHPFEKTKVELTEFNGRRGVEIYETEYIRMLIERAFALEDEGQFRMPTADRVMLEDVYGVMDLSDLTREHFVGRIDSADKAMFEKQFRERGRSDSEVARANALFDIRWGMGVLGSDSYAASYQSRSDHTVHDPLGIIDLSRAYVLDPPKGRATVRAELVRSAMSGPKDPGVYWDHVDHMKLPHTPIGPMPLRTGTRLAVRDAQLRGKDPEALLRARADGDGES